MTLDPALLHPSIRNRTSLASHQRIYLDTLQALVDSLRMPDEMAEAAGVLNPLLAARLSETDPNRISRLDDLASRALKASQGVRDGRSGMAVDLALDYLRLAFDDIRHELSQKK